MTVTPRKSLTTRLASDEADRAAVYGLRYEVFVAEMGGDGTLVDHDLAQEKDRFDPFCDHLMLLDQNRGAEIADQIVGTYRMMSASGAKAAGAFYSEGEYDLSALQTSGRKLMECGRSCLRRDYRGGLSMQMLWSGLAAQVEATGAEILFGVASFPGSDPALHRTAISWLHHTYLAAKPLRTKARKAVFDTGDLVDADDIDRVQVVRDMPALIKAYLRMGGRVGDGAFVDHAFNTCDVCMILDLNDVPAAMRARLTS